MKKKISIRLQKELYERYNTFSKHTGMSVASTILYQLGEFYAKNVNFVETLDEDQVSKITRKPKLNSKGGSETVVLSVALPLHQFLEKTASHYNIEMYELIKNIIKLHRAEIKIDPENEMD